MPGVNDIWMVSREMEGMAGAGGVKDVTAQLLTAIARRGMRATLVLPHYPLIYHRRPEFKDSVRDTGIEMAVPMKVDEEQRATFVRVYQADLDEVTVYLIDAPCYAGKEGIYVYTESEADRLGTTPGTGYEDYFVMNIILQKATLELIQHLGARPDLIHCQDAHTAFIPAMMRAVPRYRSYFESIGVGVTIHNAGPGYHQENYDLELVEELTELPPEVVRRGLHRKAVYPFILGGIYADFINTVSENYAREIMEAGAEDQQSVGIGSAFRKNDIQLVGITNGIDPAEYDPTQPARMNIEAAFDPAAGDMAGKSRCREWLISGLDGHRLDQRRMENLRVEGWLEERVGAPLVTMISRLTAQKGVDRFIPAVYQLLEGRPGKWPADPDSLFLILGKGAPRYEEALIELAHDPRFEGRVAVVIGYGPHLAKCIYAAGDFFVNPAAFEPCGLTDYMAQLMGSVPVVHLVGGLVKVEDGLTGYGYYPHTADALAETMQRAIQVFRQEPEQHLGIVRHAVARIYDRYTWDKVLERGYLPLYQQAVGQRQAGDLPVTRSR